MPFTTQLDARTPKPTERIAVEKRTKVATNAFKFGPPYFPGKYAVYMDLRIRCLMSLRLFAHSIRIDAGNC